MQYLKRTLDRFVCMKLRVKVKRDIHVINANKNNQLLTTSIQNTFIKTNILR